MVILAALGYYFLTRFSSTWINFFDCFIFSMAQGRVEWIQHEAGHFSMTGIPKLDRLIQTYLVGILMGWSGIFWRRHHNLHHAMTQLIKRDIDIDYTGIFITSKEVLDDPVNDQTFFLRNQVYFAPIFTLLAAFYVLFWETGKHLLKYKVGVEFIAIGIHYLIAYQIGFWPWIGCHVMMYYLGLNFALSHTHLPVTNKPTHWVEHRLAHSADIDQRPWCNWWMGYLNYQIEHHLFPTMPQFRNKLAVERDKALAAKHGLRYYVFSYKDAVIRAIRNLVDVSQELKRLSDTEHKS
ncbi:unnamed protein product [Orchesella dallaii]|uniref:Fatty acid desaturase domain-containing protein n=1 Tax=Orchesella dallaii TaxID=48710 RepID=A0ABP1RJN8_9HEXA